MKTIKNYTVKIFKNNGFPTLTFMYNESEYKDSETALAMAKDVGERYNKKGYNYCIFEETIKIVKMVVSKDQNIPVPDNTMEYAKVK